MNRDEFNWIWATDSIKHSFFCIQSSALTHIGGFWCACFRLPVKLYLEQFHRVFELGNCVFAVLVKDGTLYLLFRSYPQLIRSFFVRLPTLVCCVLLATYHVAMLSFQRGRFKGFPRRSTICGLRFQRWNCTLAAMAEISVKLRAGSRAAKAQPLWFCLMDLPSCARPAQWRAPSADFWHISCGD